VLVAKALRRRRRGRVASDDVDEWAVLEEARGRLLEAFGGSGVVRIV
jgi:hypothetical protein